MPQEDPKDEDAPWRQLFHRQQDKAKQQQQDPQQQQQQLPEDPEELSELQQQLLACYRKTCLVAGLGLAGAVWRWNTVAKNLQRNMFLPPRAQALPPELVERWKQRAALREALSTIGRQTLVVTGFAGLYFGVELGTGLARGRQGDWANTAVAGAVAGGFLGARVPSSLPGRTLALGAVMGGLMGAASGWAQQQLAMYEAAADGEGSSGSSNGNQPPGS